MIRTVSVIRGNIAACPWSLVLPALVVPFFGALLYFVILPGSCAAQISYGGVKAFTLIWPLAWVLLTRSFSDVVYRNRMDGNLSLMLGITSGVVLAGLFLAGVAYLWVEPTSLRAGGNGRPLILLAVVLILAIGIRAVVAASGRAKGRKALAGYRGTLTRAIRAQLDHRVGAPLRTLMRSRAEVAGTLSELGLITAALENSIGTTEAGGDRRDGVDPRPLQ